MTTVPLLPDARAVASAPRPARRQPVVATILIVDDISANRQFLVTLLREQGHRMFEAANGREGLALVRSERPDLVITDVLMPVMDGYEFVRQLRLDDAISRIPVLFYTAPYGEREARALAISGGLPYVLTKPAEPDEALRIVNRALSGEQAARTPAEAASRATEVDRQHLRLLRDRLSEKDEDLGIANARLRALINIGLELASERDSDRLLQSVCAAARDLFGATYVTLGIVDLNDRTVRRVSTCGTDAEEWIKAGDSVSGILGTVIAERRALRGANPGTDPATLQFPVLHPDVQAFLAAPLVSPAHVYGWFCLVGNEGKAFTEDDEDLVTALAAQIGRIYETRHFYAEAQARAAELEREIRERRQVESELRHERDRAQRVLDKAEVILLKLDREGRITLVNRYACSLLGRTESELLGRDWVETCLPDRIRKEFRNRFQDLVRGDLSVIENPILTKSGEERLIEWRNTQMRDDDGRVIGTFSSGTDITERHQAVEALRTAADRMTFALQNANVGIWDMDYTTGVVGWSETLEAHYGLRPGTFGGTFDAFIERIHPEDRASVVTTFQEAMKSGADFTIENRSIWPDGSVRWLIAIGRIQLGEHGEPLRGVSISLDITARRALEEQYRQAQKMEAIARLAGGVAHDFNNLLTEILGYCELLLADIDPGDLRRADIEEIQKAGSSAARLTRQMLAFSRREIVEPVLLDLNVVVADMHALLERLIGEDVTVAANLRPGLALVKADRGQMEQIVMNLAVNARDAMPHGGTLTIETAHADLGNDPCVTLTVTDTGTGMTPAVRARLFEPFFTTKGPGRGTGLGLAIVQNIALRSGGSVDVQSEPGKGTSFTISFPRVDAAGAALHAPAAALHAPAAARPRAGAETVMVVEDTAGLRALTRRLLQRLGYTVIVAASAREAVQLFEQAPSIDLLLTDVVMPDTSGPELSRQLVGRSPALKVIYMSGYTEDAIVHHGVLNPGIAFLHKPFTSETLGRKIRDVLDRQATNP